jgi:hypothetical protein
MQSIEKQENTRRKGIPHAGPGEEPGPDGLVEAGEHGVRPRRLRYPLVHPRERRRRRSLARGFGRGRGGGERRGVREVAREENPAVEQLGGEGRVRRAPAERDEVAPVGVGARIGAAGGWALWRRRGEERGQRR